MKKINPKIKNLKTLTIQDKVDLVESISSAYFQEVEDEFGNKEERYTPYLEEVGQISAIAKYLIEGIEFSKDEDVYNSVINDEDVFSLVNKFITENTEENKILEWAMKHVNDIVEHRKELNVAAVHNECNIVLAARLIEIANKEKERIEQEIEVNKKVDEFIEQQKELNSMLTKEDYEKFVKTFDADSFTSAIVSKYGETELGQRNKEVVEMTREIREKDNKIVELESAVKKLEQKENTKNVRADKKSRTKKSSTSTEK